MQCAVFAQLDDVAILSDQPREMFNLYDAFDPSLAGVTSDTEGDGELLLLSLAPLSSGGRGRNLMQDGGGEPDEDGGEGGGEGEGNGEVAEELPYTLIDMQIFDDVPGVTFEQSAEQFALSLGLMMFDDTWEARDLARSVNTDLCVARHVER